MELSVDEIKTEVTQTDRSNTGREAGRETDRPTDRQRARQTDTHLCLCFYIYI